MPSTALGPAEISQKAEEIYDRDIRPRVEQDHFGKVVVIDIETGDWEMDEDHLTAGLRVRARRPESVLFAIRIGFPAVDKIGSWGTQSCE